MKIVKYFDDVDDVQIGSVLIPPEEALQLAKCIRFVCSLARKADYPSSGLVTEGGYGMIDELEDFTHVLSPVVML